MCIRDSIDSNGQFFKASNLIKDVSKFHFTKVIVSLLESGLIFSPWLGKKFNFNFNRVFALIPVKVDRDKIKSNEALKLFASILEQRKVDKKNIYRHFATLILCHWHERYDAYSNIWQSTDFDFATKDAVFGYFAFFNTLRQLNLSLIHI